MCGGTEQRCCKHAQVGTASRWFRQSWQGLPFSVRHAQEPPSATGACLPASASHKLLHAQHTALPRVPSPLCALFVARSLPSCMPCPACPDLSVLFRLQAGCAHSPRTSVHQGSHSTQARNPATAPRLSCTQAAPKLAGAPPRVRVLCVRAHVQELGAAVNAAKARIDALSLALEHKKAETPARSLGSVGVGSAADVEYNSLLQVRMDGRGPAALPP